ncbi:transcriptional regulator [Paenibacillus sp. LMG 31456]|uniref:Transcriptional regulator n=1 Tax=Paenibacillus foliorum TaxID=2654974 RepID=A0A972GXM1_9BACL|nr:helix-turn-helix domain-containing protein [Paenibacillus foliorum]NOU95657.1 transcriptional regulator [Paenibacillus foliorum]
MDTKKELPLCPVETTVSLISNKWKTLILRELLSGTKRFGELRNGISGVSQKVLTQNLRSMEDDGIIERKAYAEVPPRVEYFLSDLGNTLRPIIDAMAEWGLGYQAKMNDSNETDVIAR